MPQTIWGPPGREALLSTNAGKNDRCPTGKPDARRWARGRRASVITIGSAALLIWAWLSGALSPALMMTSPAGRGHYDPESILAGLIVEIDGLPVEGLTRNLSGLTYASPKNTLFAVINNPPAVAELSTEGVLRRLIPITGLKDTEGISHVRDTWFLISDEKDQSIHLVQITPDTEKLTIDSPPILKLDFGFFHNLGFEGASWDSRHDLLYLVQERLPIRILFVDGLLPDPSGPERSLSVSSHALPWPHRLALLDLSSLMRHEISGRLLLLSDASKMLFEYNAEGQLAYVMRLRAGAHGLRAAIPQAEGVTMDHEGRLFIVSEPNLFYRFSQGPGSVRN